MPINFENNNVVADAACLINYNKHILTPICVQNQSLESNNRVSHSIFARKKGLSIKMMEIHHQ